MEWGLGLNNMKRGENQQNGESTVFALSLALSLSLSNPCKQVLSSTVVSFSRGHIVTPWWTLILNTISQNKPFLLQTTSCQVFLLATRTITNTSGLRTPNQLLYTPRTASSLRCISKESESSVLTSHITEHNRIRKPLWQGWGKSSPFLSYIYMYVEQSSRNHWGAA